MGFQNVIHPSNNKIMLLWVFKVFAFADKYRGPYSAGLKLEVCPFYCSYSGYQVQISKIFGWVSNCFKICNDNFEKLKSK